MALTAVGLCIAVLGLQEAQMRVLGLMLCLLLEGDELIGPLPFRLN